MMLVVALMISAIQAEPAYAREDADWPMDGLFESDYCEGVFVDNGEYAEKSGGIGALQWTQIPVSGREIYAYSNFVYFSNKFWAILYHDIWNSPDGADWTRRIGRQRVGPA